MNNIKVTVDSQKYQIVEDIKPQKTDLEIRLEAESVTTTTFNELFGRPPLSTELALWAGYLQSGVYTIQALPGAIYSANIELLSNGRYTKNYATLLKKYKAGDISLAQLVETSKDGVITEEELITAPIWKNTLFDNITVGSRLAVVPDGFTISYEPADLTGNPDHTIVRIVDATVTHTNTEAKQYYRFTETLFPIDETMTLDAFGRTIIPMSALNPTDHLNILLKDKVIELGGIFSQGNGGEYDNKVISAFTTVAGMSMLEPNDLAEWAAKAEKYNYTQEELNHEILQDIIESGNRLGVVVEHARDYSRGLYGILKDKFGRETIPYSEVPGECKTFMENKYNSSAFAEGNGSSIDTRVAAAYKEVLGRDFIGSDGYAWATNMMEMHSMSDADFKLMIANASLSADYIRCSNSTKNAIAYLKLNGETRDIINRYNRKIALAGMNGELLPNDILCKTTHGVIIDTTAAFENDLQAAYEEVLQKAYIPSDVFNYKYVNVAHDTSTTNLKKAVAFGAVASDCAYAANSAQEWLNDNSVDTTVDIYGRSIIAMGTIPSSQCSEYATKNEVYFAASNGSDGDVSVFSAYSEVLGRDYVDGEGLNHWVTQTDINSWTDQELKEALALYTVSTDTTCVNAFNKATEWLTNASSDPIPTNNDNNSRELIPNISIPDNECKTVNLALGNSYSLGNGSDNDTMVFKAFKAVLNRTYISSSSLEYWANDIANHSWQPTIDQDKLNKTVAYASIAWNVELHASSLMWCPDSLSSARTWLIDNDIPQREDDRRIVPTSAVNQDGSPKEKALIEEGKVLVFPATANDRLVANAYREVVARKYISNDGFDYWVHQLTAVYSGDINALKRVMALSVIALNDGSQEYDAAILYRNNILSAGHTINGRTTYNMNTLNLTEGTADYECKVHVLANRDKFIRSNGSANDTKIFAAYRRVLGRNYISSSGISYWDNFLHSHSIAQSGLNQRIAEASANVPTAVRAVCPTAGDNAILYLKTVVGIFNFTLSSRNDIPTGYTATFTPAEQSSVEGPHIVTYILTHIASGLRSTSAQFTETTGNHIYIEPTEVELRGTPSEIRNSQNGTLFIEAETSEEIKLFSMYVEVGGRRYLDAGGADYWAGNTGFQALSDMARKRMIATAMIAASLPTDIEYISAQHWLDANYNPFTGITSVSRTWERTGYTISFDPSAKKITSSSEHYLVVATLRKGSKHKVYTFYEDSTVEDVFRNIPVITTRLSSAPSGFTISYSEDRRTVTASNQNYTVVATITYTLTGATRVDSFREEVIGTGRFYDSHNFLLMDPATIPSNECTTGQYVKTDIIKLNPNDTKQANIFYAFKTGLNREYIHSDGHWYWYNHAWANVDKDLFALRVAGVATASSERTNHECPLTYDFARAYLIGEGYTLLDGRWYKGRRVYRITHPATTRTVNGSPIYKTVDKDWRDTVHFVSSLTAAGSGALPPSSDIAGRTAAFTEIYQTYLLRDPDSKGLHYWVYSSNVDTYEAAASSFISIRDSDKRHDQIVRIIAGYHSGYYTYSQLPALFVANDIPPRSAYVTQTQVLTGYTQVIETVPAVYGWVIEKEYL